MKKRFALPLIFGGLLVVAALPNVEGSQSAKDAAKRAAAPATAPIESKLGPDEGALTMKQRAARANHLNLQAKCASHLSDSLKDPNSMRIIDGSYGARGDRKIVVNLTYTATSSFGGRVKEQNSCTYTL